MKIYKSDRNDKNTIVSNHIMSIAEDKKGNIWVGINNGLSKIDAKDDSIDNYLGSINEKLQFYNVNDILITKSGHIMLATSSGVYVYNDKEDGFKRVFKKRGLLTNYNIIALEEDRYNNIWIGTKEGLNKVDTKTKKIYKYFNDDKSYITENYIKDIFSGNDGNMWVSIEVNGLRKINIETNEIVTYKNEESDKYFLPSNSINTMLQDKSGTMWLGTEKGLSKYIRDDDKFITYRNKSYDSSSLSDDIVYSMVEDSNGFIWVGTYIGISVFDPSNEIKIYKNDPLNKNSLSDNIIHGIYEDSKGYLWIGTNYGLLRFNLETKKLDYYTEKEGLANNTVYGILLDDYDNPWISTNNGISKLNTKTNKFMNLNNVDGLQSNEFNLSAYYKSRNGEFLFGGVNGLNSFHPDNILEELYSPVVTFDSFEIDGKSYKDINNLSFGYQKME